MVFYWNLVMLKQCQTIIFISMRTKQEHSHQVLSLKNIFLPAMAKLGTFPTHMFNWKTKAHVHVYKINVITGFHLYYSKDFLELTGLFSEWVFKTKMLMRNFVGDLINLMNVSIFIVLQLFSSNAYLLFDYFK